MADETRTVKQRKRHRRPKFQEPCPVLPQKVSVSPPTFAKLRKCIESQANKRCSLEHTVAMMSETKAFDETDVRLVQERLLKEIKTEEALRAELHKREQLYQSKVKGVQELLVSRRAALERINAESETFEHFPELAAMFAQKQLDLSGKLQKLTDTLEREWSE